VLLEPHGSTGQSVRVQAVRHRNGVWTVQKTLEVWVFHGHWWHSPNLEGEWREYHVLGTSHGMITLYRTREGWFVVGWWD
jgi:hypothetical protein